MTVGADRAVPRQGADEAGARRGGHPHAAAREHADGRRACGRPRSGSAIPLIVKPIAGAGSADTYRVDSPRRARRRPADGAARAARSASRSSSTARSSPTTRSAPAGRCCSRTSAGTARARCRCKHARVDQPGHRSRCATWTRPDLQGGRRAGRAPCCRRSGSATGFTHMEWYRKADGEVVFGEIGARPPGARMVDLMNYATDADLFVGLGRGGRARADLAAAAAALQRREHLQARRGRRPDHARTRAWTSCWPSTASTWPRSTCSRSARRGGTGGRPPSPTAWSIVRHPELPTDHRDDRARSPPTSGCTRAERDARPTPAPGSSPGRRLAAGAAVGAGRPRAAGPDPVGVGGPGGRAAAAGQRRGGGRAAARGRAARGRACSAPRAASRPCSGAGPGRPARPRSCCTRTTTCSRPATARTGTATRSSRPSGTAGCTAAAPPTTRPASRCTWRRCARTAAALPVGVTRAGRGRGGDRLAHAARASWPSIRDRHPGRRRGARRLGQLGGGRAGADHLAARRGQRHRGGAGARATACTAGCTAAPFPTR